MAGLCRKLRSVKETNVRTAKSERNIGVVSVRGGMVWLPSLSGHELHLKNFVMSESPKVTVVDSGL
jgi:hypothetical protein